MCSVCLLFKGTLVHTALSSVGVLRAFSVFEVPLGGGGEHRTRLFFLRFS